MLMFKPDDTPSPATPAYVPGKGILPLYPNDDGDKEQFYLFNRWPTFRLENNSKANPVLGTFDLGSNSLDIGRFALLWQHNAGATKWGTGAQPLHWLCANAVPSISMSGPMHTLGYLLEQCLDAQPGFGRAFNPKPPPANVHSTGDWDQLMAYLLGYYGAGKPPQYVEGYLETHQGKGAWRDAAATNTQQLAFLGARFESALRFAGMDYQYDVTFGGSPYPDFLEYYIWRTYMHRKVDTAPFGFLHKMDVPPQRGDNDDRMPVLIATVHLASPMEEVKHSR